MNNSTQKQKPKWDLTSTGSLWGAAQWIRSNSNALFVLVVRVDDMAFSVADGMRPADTVQMLREEIEGLQAMLEQYQAAQSKRAAGERTVAEATR